MDGSDEAGELQQQQQQQQRSSSSSFCCCCCCQGEVRRIIGELR
ncbi:hypothetical protein ENH_00086500 [Eimeria necatrix]|uniref:Uncharacterized protein n=1 Tax=Eimeria necatrix TaxID=51315 RepID=U6MQ60_9EIME|nr:hypothetical protein ENH_00086500 [Eimeria necatrix]CDJ64594.1 hypothetical protein ENH_00086500 [Eimeria necatrix]